MIFELVNLKKCEERRPGGQRCATAWATLSINLRFFEYSNSRQSEPYSIRSGVLNHISIINQKAHRQRRCHKSIAGKWQNYSNSSRQTIIARGEGRALPTRRIKWLSKSSSSASLLPPPCHCYRHCCCCILYHQRLIMMKNIQKSVPKHSQT